jgi:hypothetical protein
VAFNIFMFLLQWNSNRKEFLAYHKKGIAI